MIVVSNTSPICYLVLIDQIELLPELFGQIIIPSALQSELAHKDAPNVVRTWITHPPAWLQIQTVTVTSDPFLKRLHAGEQEAICLAQRLLADLLILDERLARQVAQSEGFPVTGLLGVLEEAAARELIDLPKVIDQLYRTNFRASPRMLKVLLDRHFNRFSRKQ